MDRDLGKRIASAVARNHGLTFGDGSATDIRQGNRSTPFVVARRAAMVAVYRELNWSLPRIGRLFRRNHTTVLYALMRAGVLEMPSKSGRASAKRVADQAEQKARRVRIMGLRAAGYSYAEIARALDLPPPVVGSIARHAESKRLNNLELVNGTVVPSEQEREAA